LGGDGAAEQLVNKPEPVGVEDVALAVLRDLSYPPASTIASTSPPSIPDGLPGRPTILQISSSLTLAPRPVGAEHVAQVQAVLGVSVEVRPDLEPPAADTRLTMAL